MFINFLKSLYYDAFKAIEDEDEDLFIYYLNKYKKNINKIISCNMSLLFYSIICKKYKFSFILLDEYGADPNFLFYYDTIRKFIPMLQHVIELKRISFAKLLIYNGANTTNISLSSELQEAAEIYEEKIAPYKGVENIEAYQALARVWQEIGANEENLMLKQCYARKTQTYVDKINNMDTSEAEKISLIHKMKVKMH